MNDSSDIFVVFLDLLGFKGAVESNLTEALGLLEDYRLAIGLAQDDDLTPNPTDHMRLPEIGISSFKIMIPMSDSIFIAGTCGLNLILQLSSFLYNCFHPSIHHLSIENPNLPSSDPIEKIPQMDAIYTDKPKGGAVSENESTDKKSGGRCFFVGESLLASARK